MPTLKKKRHETYIIIALLKRLDRAVDMIVAGAGIGLGFTLAVVFLKVIQFNS